MIKRVFNKKLDKFETKMKQNRSKFNSVALNIVIKINNALTQKLHRFCAQQTLNYSKYLQ